MRKKLSVFLILASVVLIIASIITTDNYDKSFWTGILSSVLVIVSMLLTLISIRKNKQ